MLSNGGKVPCAGNISFQGWKNTKPKNMQSQKNQLHALQEKFMRRERRRGLQVRHIWMEVEPSVVIKN